MTMVSKEYLTQEYTNLVKIYHPQTRHLLERCHIKIIDGYITRLRKSFYYVGIYYPENLVNYFIKYQEAFKEIADNMGLVDVVFINANRLIKDPILKIKHEDPRLWLEIYWVATHKN